MTELLEQAGYFAGSEIELRSDARWRPIPDVIGADQIEHPYPTKPVAVVVEVLLPDDRLDRTLDKCRKYARIGVKAIFVLDPSNRDGWKWNAERESLNRIAKIELPNQAFFDLADIWREMDRRMERKRE